MQLVTRGFVQSLFGGDGDERGGEPVEYALLVGLIAVVYFDAVSLLGSDASHQFSQVGSALQ